ncbi:MAG: hydrogenase [Xanthomonadaceae bacterium]|nr:hydrogenase [Xanthomonadaceae bacterium]
MNARGPIRAASPLDGRALNLRVVPLSIDEPGVVIAAAQRADFPSDTDNLLLAAACTQLSIWLRGERLHLERERAVAALAERERQKRELEDENVYLREEIQSAISQSGTIGRSAALRQVLGQIAQVAPTEATVLIFGESGTGKELLAREIHERSARAGRALIKVNCSAIPKDMFESEFFGHVRGAFTGALRDRPGRFQAAHGGTIFLDEVGDLPLELQPKLLRVLQEGQYERVGDDVTREVNVRVIAATNRDLPAAIAAGLFREDLYYRLNVFPITIPPLRERSEDIPLLAAHFAAQAARRLGLPEPRLGAAQCAALQRYRWPGNIRELGNLVERAVILGGPGPLRLDQVLPDGRATLAGAPRLQPEPDAEAIVSETEWRARECANIRAALKRAKGRIHGPDGAAELLGLKPSTLASRVKALKVRIES